MIEKSSRSLRSRVWRVKTVELYKLLESSVRFCNRDITLLILMDSLSSATSVAGLERESKVLLSMRSRQGT